MRQLRDLVHGQLFRQWQFHWLTQCTVFVRVMLVARFAAVVVATCFLIQLKAVAESGLRRWTILIPVVADLLTSSEAQVCVCCKDLLPHLSAVTFEKVWLYFEVDAHLD